MLGSSLGGAGGVGLQGRAIHVSVRECTYQQIRSMSKSNTYTGAHHHHHNQQHHTHVHTSRRHHRRMKLPAQVFDRCGTWTACVATPVSCFVDLTDAPLRILGNPLP